MIILWYNTHIKKRLRGATTPKSLVHWRHTSMNPNSTPDTVLIPLTQNQFAIVDPIDADLTCFKWRVLSMSEYARRKGFTAVRSIYIGNHKSRNELMHRVILARKLGRDLQSTELVDHANGNPLDNRRANLRLATRSQNMMNRSKNINNQSGFKGVIFHKESGKWRAVINANKKRHRLGLFDTPEEAHAAYCKAAEFLHGEFANFGEEIHDEL